MPKEARGKETWLRLLEEYEQTELTQAAFAEQKGVKLATFRYWLYEVAGPQKDVRLV